MKNQEHHDIAIEQQGQRSTSLAGDQPQIFQIEGDFHYQEANPQEVQQGSFPLSPIPDPGVFIGREILRTELERFFQHDSAKVFFLEGLGGIGKTALAAYACRKFLDAFQDIYWGNCIAKSSVEKFVGELYVIFARNEKKGSGSLYHNPHFSIEAQIRVVLELLKNAKYLLIFDDFQRLLDQDGHFKDPDLELFFQQLIRGGHHSKIFFISRRSFVFRRQPTGVIIRKRLTGLRATSVKTLFEKLGMEFTIERRALYTKVGGHPLALRMLSDLYQRGEPLEQLLKTPFRELGRENEDLCNDLFSEVWNMMRPEDIEVLRWLSTYRIPVPFQAINIFASKFEDLQEDSSQFDLLHTAVRFLDEHCLLEVHKDREAKVVYTVPQIIREFVFRSLTKQQQQEYHSKVANYLFSSAWSENPIRFEGLQKQREAIYHSFQAGKSEQAIKLATLLSGCLCRCGLGDMAKAMLKEIAGSGLSDENLATGYNALGNICTLQGDYRQSLCYYRKAYDIHQHLGNQEWVATINNNIGAVYASYGNYSFALQYYEKARKIFQRLKLEPELATSYNNIGFVHACLGEHIRALKYHGLAREIQKRLELEVDLASSYNNIGFIYDAQREYCLALDYYEMARKIRERLGLEVDLAESYNNIGSIYAAQNEFEKALHYYAQAEEILERLELEVNLAKCYNNIGLIYTKQKKTALALQQFERAREIQERLELDVDLANTYNNIGFVYASLGSPMHALWFYERAREIQERLGLSVQLSTTFANMGQIYYQQGNYQKAEKAISVSIILRKKINHPDLEILIAFLKHIRSCLSQKD